jgi:hypothetical protein
MTASGKFTDAVAVGASIDLLTQYRAARNQLDASVLLLQRALDLHEQLSWGLDLENMVNEVGELKRAVSAHKCGRGA